MSEITEADLAPNVKALYLKARSAVQTQNYGYAIKLLQSVLKDAPTFLDGRKALRNCASLHTGGPKKSSKVFGFKTGGVGTMKIAGQVKKDPVAALVMIEDELEKDPYNLDVNDQLFEAFSAMGLPDHAAFALETIRKGHPEELKPMHKLAEFYIHREDPAKAAEVYRDILKHHPTDSVAIKGEKDCTARASMQKGGWSENANMADLQRNKGEAAELDAAGRSGLTRDQLEDRRDRLILKYNEDPNQLPVVKDLAGIFEQLEDWANSHTFYSWGYSLSNGDVALQTKSGQMKDKMEEQQLKDLEARAASNPDDPEVQAMLAERKVLRIAEALEEAKKRVDVNPTDPTLRYQLGQAYYDAGDYSNAIPHLQQAKRNPHIQSKVLLLLGRTFKAKGMLDMSLRQLTDALGDLIAMDNVKKEILFEKGLVHEEMGDKPGALEAFKQIYEVDYGYRDVAHRVESSYGG
ncbi:tetratricopeptide repeat protein [Luteolibacter flavescens]|uniref:Tetratricopeptide repeat protein n=1 Tax=Luteolibacter flavescens TaxID=1859460 RepID=A0ABT3FT22_9BACT|nr:tetratricopeptide repeat protein [Luteolibacter flavescens]MCW1886454.1 tetratricopeptide repeat protein [Luteolibacter flavescens]